MSMLRQVMGRVRACHAQSARQECFLAQTCKGTAVIAGNLCQLRQSAAASSPPNQESIDIRMNSRDRAELQSS